MDYKTNVMRILDKSKIPVPINNKPTIAGLKTRSPAISWSGYAISTVIRVPKIIYIPSLNSEFLKSLYLNP